MEDETARSAGTLARPPADARCAVHFDVEAFAVCQRCGNYMCRACSREGTSSQCDACRARGAAEFPFSRDRWSFSDLLAYCWKRFKAEWLMLSVTSLTFLVLVYGLSFGVTFAGVVLTTAVTGTGDPDTAAAASVLRMSIQVVQVVLQVVLQLWLQLGFLAVALDVVEGRRAEVGKLFTRFDRFPSAVLQLAIIYAGMAVYAAPLAAVYFLFPAEQGDNRAYAVLAVGAVLAIPALYLALGCAFAMLELVHDPSTTAMQALRNSFQIVRGRRLAVFGSAFAIACIVSAGFVACCIGVVPSLALGTLIYCALFLALKTPTPA